MQTRRTFLGSLAALVTPLAFWRKAKPVPMPAEPRMDWEPVRISFEAPEPTVCCVFDLLNALRRLTNARATLGDISEQGFCLTLWDGVFSPGWGPETVTRSFILDRVLTGDEAVPGRIAFEGWLYMEVPEGQMTEAEAIEFARQQPVTNKGKRLPLAPPR